METWDRISWPAPAQSLPCRICSMSPHYNHWYLQSCCHGFDCRCNLFGTNCKVRKVIYDLWLRADRAMIMEHPIVGNTRLIRRETSLDITFLVVLRPNVQGVRKKMCFSPRIFSILRLLPSQHWAVIGCTKYGQPIRVTLSILRKSLSAICRRGMGCSGLGKYTIFPEHPVYPISQIAPRSTCSIYLYLFQCQRGGIFGR